jgi:hypothetical protein
LQREKLWEDMKVVIRVLFPGFLLLWLADKSELSMDKLYFSIRRMDIALKRSRVLLNQLEEHYTGGSGHILRNMAKYFLLPMWGMNSSIVVMILMRVMHIVMMNRSNLQLERILILIPMTQQLLVLKKSKERQWIRQQDDCILELTKKTILDVAITAWMVSPLPDIMQDV